VYSRQAAVAVDITCALESLTCASLDRFVVAINALTGWATYYTPLPKSSSYLNISHVFAALSKTWVCGLSLAAIAGSNRARGMDACLL